MLNKNQCFSFFSPQLWYLHVLWPNTLTRTQFEYQSALHRSKNVTSVDQWGDNTVTIFVLVWLQMLWQWKMIIFISTTLTLFRANHTFRDPQKEFCIEQLRSGTHDEYGVRRTGTCYSDMNLHGKLDNSFCYIWSETNIVLVFNFAQGLIFSPNPETWSISLFHIIR